MQFGFVLWRGITDTIVILRQMQEKFIGADSRLYMTFVDLENAFDSVPREVPWWTMRKLLVEE